MAFNLYVHDIKRICIEISVGVQTVHCTNYNRLLEDVRCRGSSCTANMLTPGFCTMNSVADMSSKRRPSLPLAVHLGDLNFTQ